MSTHRNTQAFCGNDTTHALHEEFLIVLQTCGFGYGMGLECAPCPENTYNQDPEAWRCLPCTDCSLYGRVHRYRCRPQLNAECGPCIQGLVSHRRAKCSFFCTVVVHNEIL